MFAYLFSAIALATPHALPDPPGLHARVGVEQGLWSDSALSPDGRRVVVDAGEVEVIEVHDGEEYVGHDPRPGPLKVLDVHTLEVVSELPLGPDREVLDVAYGRERVAAVLRRDDRAQVRIWDAGSGSLLHEIEVPPHSSHVVLSANGARLLVAGDGIRSVDIGTGAVSAAGEDAFVLAMDEAGERCALSSPLRVIDCASLQVQQTLDVEEVVNRAAFTTSGQLVVSTDGWELLWFDAESGVRRHRYHAPDEFDVHFLVPGRDGRVWSRGPGGHGPNICPFDPERGECRPVPKDLTSFMETDTGGAGTTYHGLFASSGTRGTQVVAHPANVRVANDVATVLDSYGRVRTWDLRRGESTSWVHTATTAALADAWLPQMTPAQRAVLAARTSTEDLDPVFAAGDLLVVVGSDLVVLDPEGTERLRLVDSNLLQSDLAASLDGRWLAIPSYDSPVSLVDLKRGAVAGHLPVQGERATWSADSSVLAVWGGTLADDVVTLVDAKTGDTRHTLRAAPYVADVAFSPSGDWLVVANGRGEVEVWSADGERRIHRFRAQEDIGTLTFDDEGRLVTVGAGELRVWEARAIQRGRAGAR